MSEFRCGKCGTVVAPRARFCPHCRTGLSGTKKSSREEFERLRATKRTENIKDLGKYSALTFLGLLAIGVITGIIFGISRYLISPLMGIGDAWYVTACILLAIGSIVIAIVTSRSNLNHTLEEFEVTHFIGILIFFIGSLVLHFVVGVYLIYSLGIGLAGQLAAHLAIFAKEEGGHKERVRDHHEWLKRNGWNP